jgi:hypothetical protein
MVLLLLSGAPRVEMLELVGVGRMWFKGVDKLQWTHAMAQLLWGSTCASLHI